MSGNTFGATLYSDGKQIAPMLPRFPNLTKCKKCNSTFWLSDLKEIGECGWGANENPAEWENAPYADFLNIEDLFRALNEYKDNEMSIRQDIWWSYNDRVRNNQKLFMENSPNDEAMWKENCESLIDLLDNNDTSQKIMIAELYRNLVQFEKCVEIIENLPKDFDWIKKQFIDKCKQKNQFVFSIER
jgi:hypothetical protein